MILSHKHQFIFFKTPKCAGSSIEGFLSQICGPKDTVTPVGPPPPGHKARNINGWREHQACFQFIDRSPELFKKYFTLSVDRNPWDKAVSQYCMNNSVSNDKSSFRNFIMSDKYDQRVINGRTKHSIDNVVVVDYVMMYHKLQDELEHVIHDILKIDKPVVLSNAKGNYRPRHENKINANKHDYTDWYTDAEMIERIADLYAYEIKTFGFVYGKQFRTG